MPQGQHGRVHLGKKIEQRLGNVSGDLLNILELLVEVNDSRFESARRQVLDIVNGASRDISAELNDYKVEHLKRESLVSRGKSPPGGSREER
jgi:CRISPR/Cas system-associated protein Csm6